MCTFFYFTLPLIFFIQHTIQRYNTENIQLGGDSYTLPVSMSSFSSVTRLFFIVLSVSTQHLFAALPFLSCCLSIVLSFLPPLSDFYIVEAVNFYTPAITSGTVQRLHSHCASMSRPKTGIRNDSNFWDLFLQKLSKAPCHPILFSIFLHVFFFLSVKLRKSGQVV